MDSVRGVVYRVLNFTADQAIIVENEIKSGNDDSGINSMD